MEATNPNLSCTCTGPGICARHGVTKNRLEFETCAGIGCSPAVCAKHFAAWEAGKKQGQTGPVASPRQASIAPGRGLGDWVAGGIKAATFGWIKPCGGCTQRQAWLNHWFPAERPPIERVDLSSARRHLTFHVWPVKDFGAWQWNCDRLLANAALFNGRRIVSIVTSGETDAPEAVQEYLRGFTDEFIVMPNNSKLREVITWLPMLTRLREYDSPHDVTFTCHAKCVRHNIGSDTQGSTIFRWTQAMWETCLAWDIVRPILETHGCAGSFRRFTPPHRGGFGPWHYSGTFYWFRNADAWKRNWEYVPKKFFGTEAWPGHLFHPDEAGVIACDDVGDLYNLDYWRREIEPKLADWSAGK